MMKNNSLAVVILAAGSSSRMGGTGKKEFRSLGKGTVLSSSLKAFLNAAEQIHVSSMTTVICCIPGLEEQTRDILFSDPDLKEKKESLKINFIAGGKSRQESVYLALSFLNNRIPDDTIVHIHDGARPYLTPALIVRITDAAENHGAAVPGLVPVDTQKVVDKEGQIECHLKREELIAVQTPQAFEFGTILKCHDLAKDSGNVFTDDSEIWDAYPELTGSRKVRVVSGEAENIKITFPKDIPDAQDILQNKGEHMIRIGFGTDLHVLKEGRKFVVGGVEIPFEKGEDGHSDGDVLLHAISDALLGASGLGDIGSYFPPEDPKWKDADSKVLLKKIWNDVKANGWSLVNLDSVLELEKPKFLPYRMQVIKSIAQILEVKEEQVFVKAKTNEKQDAVGAGLAVKAYCTCLLEKKL
ncbi:MAG: 2-C-methyl-D-erythritol 2,4-cyclodiphosphate synthase [Treponema sp.]|nr:2-C-methyl-D-erythritol 2,4-cyclodiphosphate synthase [Treponema sp.]